MLKAGGVAGKGALPPAQRRSAGVDHPDRPRGNSLGIQGKIGDPLHPRGGVRLSRRIGELRSSIRLTEAGGAGVLPRQMAVGAETGSGVEEFILAADVDDGEIVVE